MNAEDLLTHILAWAGENTHRGRLANAFRTNLGNSPKLQAQRVGMLSVYLEREAKSRKGLSLV